MNESLTNRQIAFTLFGAIVGYGIISLPKSAAEKAGTGAWISLLIATFMAALITYMITRLSYFHRGKTIYEYSRMLTGKFFGGLIVLLYILYFFILFTLVTRNAGEVIKVSILVKTPIWASILIFLSVVYYAVIKGLQNIAKINELYGVFIIIMACIIYIIMSTQGEIINIRPFFGALTPLTYLKASAYMVVPFLGIEILLVIPLNSKTKKSIFTYTIVTILSIGLLYIFEVEAVIAVRGVRDIVRYRDALLDTIRTIDIPNLEFLRRLDGIFLVAWIMAIFTTITLYAYACIFLLSKLFNKVNFNRLAFIVIVCAYILSLVPQTDRGVDKAINMFSIAGIFMTIVIPAILLIITKVKINGKNL